MRRQRCESNHGRAITTTVSREANSLALVGSRQRNISELGGNSAASTDGRRHRPHLEFVSRNESRLFELVLAAVDLDALHFR